jgi:hypothetical protein
MKPYVLTLLTLEEINLFKTVSWVVDAIPDELWDTTKEGHLRCHELARAVHDWVTKQPPNRWGARALSIGICDGKYGAVDHSWIETGIGENILDVYAVGELPPVQLRHGSNFLPKQYVPGRLRGDIREDMIEHLISIFDAADAEMHECAVEARGG